MQKNESYTFRFLRVALLLFFIGHYSNSTMFFHTHEVDGRLFCHSHFFGIKKSKGFPVTAHTHTTNQLQLIDTFNTISLTDALEIPEIPTPDINFIVLKQVGLPQKQLLNIQLNLRLRAPPAC